MLRKVVTGTLACTALTGVIVLTTFAQSAAQPPASGNNAQKRDALYQVSLLQSLTEGDFEGSVSVGELKKHGNTGIGTFDGLNGELIMLDGEVWQAAGDGSVNLMKDDVTVPFGNVSFLDSDETLDVSGATSFENMLQMLDARVQKLGVNNFYLVRIDGSFDKMNVRSERKQSEPYPTIVDALAVDQTLFNLENVEGSMVGVYCPPYMSSINSVGWHFHFLSNDHTQGGHVLDCAVRKAEATIDQTKELDLSLPSSQKFENTDFTVDRSADVKKAETDKE